MSRHRGCCKSKQKPLHAVLPTSGGHLVELLLHLLALFCGEGVLGGGGRSRDVAYQYLAGCNEVQCRCRAWSCFSHSCKQCAAHKLVMCLVVLCYPVAALSLADPKAVSISGELRMLLPSSGIALKGV